MCHYTPSIENQTLIKEQILNKDPTELNFIERTVFRKNVDTNNNWIFELGQSENLNPVYIIVGFMRFENLILRCIIIQYLIDYQF